MQPPRATQVRTEPAGCVRLHNLPFHLDVPHVCSYCGQGMPFTQCACSVHTLQRFACWQRLDPTFTPFPQSTGGFRV